MANKGGAGKILIYSLPFLVGGVLIYFYIRKKKQLQQANQGQQQTSPEPSTEPTQSILPSGGFNTLYYIVTSSGSLNVRKKPDGFADVVGKLAKGSSIYGKPSGTSGWIAVSKDGINLFGYASSGFLTTNKPSTTTAPTTSGFENVGRPTGTTTTLPPRADTTSGTEGVGRPSGSGTSSPFSTKYKVVTSSGSLNVRNKPDGSATITDKLAKGTIIFGRQSSVSAWIEVSKDGLNSSGFASKTYLSTAI